ncbi:aminotransferase-like domain-containing protein [Hymenobacter cellulosivorans]|uniref:PLP-dependent aminotransferase family protein n=1 Tax=Hymenobacter cellulosivorans TaxID=2932249 RepID=A0ABY4F2F4_9BACT|nr:PLP-dependent aminotransferase family protein [Hymenobacter cellulosivorans]UOQ50713.1 PLP-dependent aminotransferase family protein [Hymenobacter cellulosivorans]
MKAASPVTLPYATLIPLERHGPNSLSQQVTSGFIHLIQQGLLPAGAKLPGTRSLAGLLGLHRQTVVVAFDELVAQGWIEQLASKGARVSSSIPVIRPAALSAGTARRFAPRAGFAYEPVPPYPTTVRAPYVPLVLDAGSPDSRLAPLASLARKYRAVCLRASQRRGLGYADPNGSGALRQQLAQYLQGTRGLPAQVENVFVTRGSSMSLYLLLRLLLRPGDTVVVGERSYHGADYACAQQGARLERVRVDTHGLNLEEVEAVCRRQAVRLLYVTPHHHYPTTVMLAADRRVRLLQLAEQYDFIILEDDYDYDFHYDGAPILPLASADRHGRVLYLGSLSKVLAPAFRVGYVVAPPDIIEALGQLRRHIDHQGDAVLEQTIAELFAEGELGAHLKRARYHYQQRRDVFCTLLRQQAGSWLTFDAPAGGMAVWVRFGNEVHLNDLSARCRLLGLGIGDGRLFQAPTETRAHHLRLGFASLTPHELTHSVAVMQQALSTLYSS